jgi:DNA helicase TIP49 (TBP-interacting protein)
MLNQSGITKTSGTTARQILFNVQNQVSVGAVIGQTGAVTVGTRKIQKAGTPMFGDINSRTTAYVPETTSTTSNANAVLLHDVDVTDGNVNGTVLIFGFVNTNRLESDVQAKITSAVKTALDAKVTFIAG